MPRWSLGREAGRWLWRAVLADLARAGWVGYGAALASVAIVSVPVAYLLDVLHLGNVSMLYLIAVLATALAFGHGPAIVASIAAFLVYDWFFTVPLYTLTVADPIEWVGLLLFLVVAIVTSQLTAIQRRQAQEAQQREREAVVLYDVVRLMAEPDLDRSLRAVAERLRQELELAAATIEVDPPTAVRAEAGDDESLGLARATTHQPARVLGGGPAPTEDRRGAPGRWIHVVPPERSRRFEQTDQALRRQVHVVPVTARDRRVGTLTLVRSADGPAFGYADDRLLSAVAAQLGLAVERNRLQAVLTENEILRRTDELKTALLNAVSHDLRTPLASIIASGASLRRPDVAWTDQERQELGAVVEEEALRLNQIVGNLLDLSRVEGGALRLEKDLYSLGALVDDVLGRLGSRIARHSVVVDVPDELPPVLLDYLAIDQVLSNLVENAAKHTPPGTEIRITARQRGGEIWVEVADRGPGIPPGSIPHLFEPFYRLEGPGPRPQGIGLGLTVAKGLVEAHGGRIWAENRPGGGARFAFSLPTTQGTAPPGVHQAGAEGSAARPGEVGR